MLVDPSTGKPRGFTSRRTTKGQDPRRQEREEIVAPKRGEEVMASKKDSGKKKEQKGSLPPGRRRPVSKSCRRRTPSHRVSPPSTRKDVVPALTKQFNYKKPMQVPRLEKIVINMGLGPL